MANLIYSIKVNELYYSGLSVLDVKIGKTTNINSTLTQYKRSSRDVKILDLWEPNENLQLSECERGVHRLAEKYAYERKSEKFIFLQDDYDEFSDNVSLLLKKSKYAPKQNQISRMMKTVQKTKSELDRLEKASDTVNKLFGEIKTRMLNYDRELIFNPQKHYISIRKKKNFAYIEIKMRKIRMVVMLPLSVGKKMIKNHIISELSQGVKDYYAGECFAIHIEKEQYMDEVISLLKKANEYNL
ncbi:MAG: DUF5655 domain-containing protein [Promethearchaeota archaeon]